MILTRVLSGLGVALAVTALGSTSARAAHDPVLAEEERAVTEGVKELLHEAKEDPFGTHDEHAKKGEVSTDPLELKKDLAIWTAVIFLLLLAVLWKFAWKPIAEGLEKREKGIADQIDGAEQANRDARQLLAQYEQKLAGATDEVRRIIERGRHDAEQVGREMVDKAKTDADAERQRALQDIDTATAGALKELAEKSADLAVDLAGKIVRAELKPADHASLIERTMSDFGRQPPSNN